MRILVILSCVCSLAHAYAKISPRFRHTGWGIVNNRSLLHASRSTVAERQANIFDRFMDVDRLLSADDKYTGTINLHTLADVVWSNTYDTRVAMDLHELVEALEQVNDFYEEMRKYATVGYTANKANLEDFAKEIVSYRPTSVKMLMQRIHKYVTPSGKRGFFQLASDNTIKKLNEQVVATFKQSMNQLLYRLYRSIAFIEIKAYVLIQFSYQLLEIYNVGTYLAELKLTNEQFDNISKKAVQIAKTAISKASTQFWMYGPETYEEGTTYLQMIGIGQGFVVNEKVLRTYQSCYGKCAAFQEQIITHGHYKDHHKDRCDGIVYSCRNLNDLELWVCPAVDKRRRYDYIEYSSGAIAGWRKSCPNKEKKTAPKSSVETCPYCLCLCDQQVRNTSHRFFSLREAVSDIAKNKVVTGLRFIKRYSIIHLQVQQGLLLPYGVIDAETLEWVPVDNFTVNTKKVYHKQDYFKMNWKNRILDLHTLPIEKNNDLQEALLTGVRFNWIDSAVKDIDTRLYLEIQLTRFNFNEGKLYPKDASMWVDGTDPRSSNKRVQINTEYSDLPMRAHTKNTIRPVENSYVKFGPSSIIKDVGQTTLPFLDAQSVAPSTATPLRGAGLYYKASDGYAGFVGLKLLTYDFSKHFSN